MNVLAMVRKEFKVDDKRIYLMGHSMGGAGALFLGGKYANMFAAVGAEAPAAFWQTRKETLQPMKDAKVPVMIVHGDTDEVVPVTNSRGVGGHDEGTEDGVRIRGAAGHQSRSGDPIGP